jgi:hypothetical protein
VSCAFLGRLLREAKPHHHREQEDQAQREWVRRQTLERIRSKQPDVIDLTDDRRVEPHAPPPGPDRPDQPEERG